MPPRSTSWRAVLPGLVTALVVLIAAVAIAAFMRPGALHGRTFRLYVTTNDVTGVMKGTEVWLSGQKVGRVERITYLPVSAPATNRVLIETRILERHHAAVRRDSRVTIGSGSTLVGVPVVQLSAGTPRTMVVANGDTIHARVRSDMEGLASKAAVGARELPLVMQNVKLLGAQLRGAEGTIGALRAGIPELDETRSRAGRIMSSVRGGRGTLGLALGGRGALMARARVAMARADSVRALLASPNGNLGRFRRDSTLLREVQAIRDELAIVSYRMSTPDGTLGRLAADSAIQRGVLAAKAEMTSLFADLKKHPFRYINFF